MVEVTTRYAFKDGMHFVEIGVDSQEVYKELLDQEELQYLLEGLEESIKGVKQALLRKEP